MIILKNSAFWDYNFNFHRMIDAQSNNDNMHKNGMFYVLIFANNHIITCIDCILSAASRALDEDQMTYVMRRFFFTGDVAKFELSIFHLQSISKRSTGLNGDVLYPSVSFEPLIKDQSLD